MVPGARVLQGNSESVEVLEKSYWLGYEGLDMETVTESTVYERTRRDEQNTNTP